MILTIGMQTHFYVSQLSHLWSLYFIRIRSLESIESIKKQMENTPAPLECNSTPPQNCSFQNTHSTVQVYHDHTFGGILLKWGDSKISRWKLKYTPKEYPPVTPVAGAMVGKGFLFTSQVNF